MAFIINIDNTVKAQARPMLKAMGAKTRARMGAGGERLVLQVRDFYISLVEICS